MTTTKIFLNSSDLLFVECFLCAKRFTCIVSVSVDVNPAIQKLRISLFLMRAVGLGDAVHLDQVHSMLRGCARSRLVGEKTKI